MKVTIRVHRVHQTSDPFVFEDVKNTYTKGPLYCLRLPDGATLKFPLCSVFTIREEKGYTSQEKTSQ